MRTFTGEIGHLVSVVLSFIVIMFIIYCLSPDLYFGLINFFKQLLAVGINGLNNLLQNGF